MNSCFDFVATDFDNVATEFWCSSLVLVATGMPCVETPNLCATSFLVPLASEICHDKHFSFKPVYPIVTEYSLSCQDYLESLVNYVTIGNFLVAIDFIFLIPVVC